MCDSDYSTDAPSVVTLPNGISLAYAEYGALDGVPVLYFHGFPGSRLEAALGHRESLQAGVRLIAPDRPGYGASPYQPRRKLADWPITMCMLADHLGIGRFAVVGVSGGGPYAAACAALTPERLTTVYMACPLGPIEPRRNLNGMRGFNRCGLRLVEHIPWIARPVLALARLLALRDPMRIVRFIEGHAAEEDKAVLSDRSIRGQLAASFREGLRPGAAGPARDLLLYTSPWGFRLEDIAIAVHLWQGEEDRIVPPAMARYYESVIPQCRATFCPGEGHFSLVINRLAEVFDTAVRNFQIDGE